MTDFLVYIPRDTSLGEWFIKTFQTNRWPAFNVADVCIGVGVGLSFSMSCLLSQSGKRAAAEATRPSLMPRSASQAGPAKP